MSMDEIKVIGLCGKKETGKTTAGLYLSTVKGYKRVRFADRLKNMLKALGLSDREIDGDLKEVECNHCMSWSYST